MIDPVTMLFVGFVFAVGIVFALFCRAELKSLAAECRRADEERDRLRIERDELRREIEVAKLRIEADVLATGTKCGWSPGEIKHHTNEILAFFDLSQGTDSSECHQ